MAHLPGGGPGPGDFGVAHTDYYFLEPRKLQHIQTTTFFAREKSTWAWASTKKCQKTHFAQAPQAPKTEKVCRMGCKNVKKWRRRRQKEKFGAAGAKKMKNCMFPGKHFSKNTTENAISEPRPRWPRWAHTDYYFFDRRKPEHIQTTTFFGQISPGPPPPPPGTLDMRPPLGWGGGTSCFRPTFA